MGDRLGIPRVVDFSFSPPFLCPYMHFRLLLTRNWAIAQPVKRKQRLTPMASLKRETQNMKK